MARTKGDHDVRRDEISQSACAVILEVGIEQTTLRDIAMHLGCTTGVIQHYFADKEALLLHAKNRLFDQAFARMQAAAARARGAMRLRAMAGALLPLDKRRLQMFQLLAAFRGRAIGRADLMALQRDRDALGWKLFADEIAALVESGDLPADIDHAAEAVILVAFVEGLATQLLMGARPIARRQIEAALDRHLWARCGIVIAGA
jgi:AcrR family transcriptional regulator